MAIKRIKQQDSDQQPTVEAQHNFYDAYYSQEVRIRFNKLKIVNLLRNMGFFRYDVPNSQQSEMVLIKDNRIQIASVKMIRDAFENYILALPDYEQHFMRKVTNPDGTTEMQPFIYTITPNFILGKLYDNLQNLFSSDLLERLRPLNSTIEVLEDNIREKYFFFNNTAVVVDASGIREIPYKDLQGYVWENSIINRDYKPDYTKGDFEVFISDICGSEDMQRKKSLMSILGYLMHNNYETNLKAVMLTDVNEDDAGTAAGGTGKGIIGKALSQMLNRNISDIRYLNIAGKDFEFKDTRYSKGDITTQLIHIEDVGKRFSFSDLYNDITDGCTFRKLHQNPTVHFCKIMLSANQTINFHGSSDKRRIVLFELKNYYSDKYTPIDKFGKRFFESQWTDEDWNLFYNFMLQCELIYMQRGIIEPSMLNYENRLIQEQLPEDFVFFFEQEIKDAVAHQTRTEYVKKNMWDRFIFKYNSFTKYGQATFTKWCKEYLRLKNIRSAELRKKVNNDYQDVILLYQDSYEKVYKYIVK